MPLSAPSHKHTRALRRQGYALVAGVDEVGRGCWAGPVTVAAVILPYAANFNGLTDSKLLSPAKRERLARDIKRQAISIGIGWVSAPDIDSLGLTAALRLAGTRALADLVPAPQAVILDGASNYLGTEIPTRTIVKADQLSLSVAAASVVAKVARDAYMTRLSRRYVGYGFDAHKGYGTPLHRDALALKGPTVEHRLTWRPLRATPTSVRQAIA